MQLSDVEFFYSFIKKKKKSESNFTIKTQDHKFQLYLSYLLILSCFYLLGKVQN